MDDEMIINPTDSEYSYEDSRSKGKKIGLRQHKSVVNDSNLSIINEDDDLESMFPKQPIMAPISKRFKSSPAIMSQSPRYHTRK